MYVYIYIYIYICHSGAYFCVWALKISHIYMCIYTCIYIYIYCMYNMNALCWHHCVRMFVCYAPWLRKTSIHTDAYMHTIDTQYNQASVWPISASAHSRKYKGSNHKPCAFTWKKIRILAPTILVPTILTQIFVHRTWILHTNRHWEPTENPPLHTSTQIQKLTLNTQNETHTHREPEANCSTQVVDPVLKPLSAIAIVAPAPMKATRPSPGAFVVCAHACLLGAAEATAKLAEDPFKVTGLVWSCWLVWYKVTEYVAFLKFNASVHLFMVYARRLSIKWGWELSSEY